MSSENEFELTMVKDKFFWGGILKLLQLNTDLPFENSGYWRVPG